MKPMLTALLLLILFNTLKATTSYKPIIQIHLTEGKTPEPEWDDLKKKIVDLHHFEPSVNSAVMAQQALILFFSQIEVKNYAKEIPFDFAGVKSITITRSYPPPTSYKKSYLITFDQENGLSTIDFGESMFKVSYDHALPVNMVYTYKDKSEETRYKFYYKDNAVKIVSLMKNNNFTGESDWDEDLNPYENMIYDKHGVPQFFFDAYYYENNDNKGFQITVFDSNDSSDTFASFYDKKQSLLYDYLHAPMGLFKQVFQYTNQREFPYEIIEKEKTEEGVFSKSSVKKPTINQIQVDCYRKGNSEKKYNLYETHQIHLNDRNLPVKFEIHEKNNERNQLFYTETYTYTYF